MSNPFPDTITCSVCGKQAIYINHSNNVVANYVCKSRKIEIVGYVRVYLFIKHSISINWRGTELSIKSEQQVKQINKGWLNEDN